jgi:hypothetical protein
MKLCELNHAFKGSLTLLLVLLHDSNDNVEKSLHHSLVLEDNFIVIN